MKKAKKKIKKVSKKEMKKVKGGRSVWNEKLKQWDSFHDFKI